MRNRKLEDAIAEVVTTARAVVDAAHDARPAIERAVHGEGQLDSGELDSLAFLLDTLNDFEKVQAKLARVSGTDPSRD